jgi:hypothetical protein
MVVIDCYDFGLQHCRRYCHNPGESDQSKSSDRVSGYYMIQAQSSEAISSRQAAGTAFLLWVFRHIEHKTSIASQLIDNYNEYNR